MINSIKELLINDNISDQLVQIYTGDDGSDSFNLGKIISVGEDSYVYVSIDKKGFMDGIRFGCTNDICRISNTGKYIDKFQKIIRLFDRKFDLKEYTDFFKKDECDLFLFLKYAYENKRVVSLSLCGSNIYDVTGFISSYNDKTLIFKEIDKYGEEVETSIIDIQSIDFCSCGSEDEKIIEALYNCIGND